MAKETLPADVVSIIYFCEVCKGKHTYGRDYFTEVGAPEKCPNCDTPFVQPDRIPRLDKDSHEDLQMKRDDLFRKRGEKIPVKEKPQDPEEFEKMRIKELEDKIKVLKGEKPDVPGVRLGP